MTPFVTVGPNGQSPGAVEDYTGQPYDHEVPTWQVPWDVTLHDQVRNRALSELDGKPQEYPTLRQKLDFELGTPNVCDPVESFVCNPDEPPSERERQRRCDLEQGGEGADPDPTRSIAVGHPDLYEVHMPFNRREVGSGPGDPLVSTALKKGWTRPHSRQEWAGWGWRHITAKHGWRLTDIEATQQALGYPPIRQPNGALRYQGPVYERNGEICMRVVIVGDTARPGQPEPPEIITSYGELIE